MTGTQKSIVKQIAKQGCLLLAIAFAALLPMQAYAADGVLGDTGDSFPIWIFIVIGIIALVAIIAAIVILMARRRNAAKPEKMGRHSR